MTTAERTLRMIRDAIALHRLTSPGDAGNMAAQRARAAVGEALRECDEKISAALHELAVDEETGT